MARDAPCEMYLRHPGLRRTCRGVTDVAHVAGPCVSHGGRRWTSPIDAHRRDPRRRRRTRRSAGWSGVDLADDQLFVGPWSSCPPLIENDALDVLHAADDAREGAQLRLFGTSDRPAPAYRSPGQQPAPEGAPPGGMPWFDAFVDNPALQAVGRIALCVSTRRAHCRPPPPFSCKAVDEALSAYGTTRS